VALNWTSAAGATGYRLYRRLASGGAYAQIYQGANTAFVDNGVTNGVAYGYVVTSYDATRESVHSTEVSATPSAPPPPLSPPAEIPTQGLVLVLDAGNIALTAGNGSEVTQWRDASGGVRDATISTGFGPTLITGALGGKPVVRFDGQNDYLNLANGFENFTAGLTLFVVARPSSLQTGSKLFLLGNGSGQANVVLGRNGGDAGLQYFTTDAGGNFGWFGTQPALTNGEAAVYAVTQPGGPSSAPVQATVSRNGINVGSGTVYVPPVTTRGVNYIGRSYWGGDGYFAGDIAEVIVYNRQLSPSEQTAVQTYLGQKYGITLP
jgi:hypothetical protein